MSPDAPIFPAAASTFAHEVDRLFFSALGMSLFFTLLIAGLIVFFGVRYRRRHPDEVGAPPLPPTWRVTALEAGWMAVPLAVTALFFAWGAQVYLAMARPPSGGERYTVVARQWMWKVQHTTGKREINALHVPLGRPVVLSMTSEDVIHSFYVPAFRVKQDVLPGRYTTVWFEADRPGTYHLFCAEYCGAEHSRMVGSVIVLPPHEYEAWLAGAPQGGTPADDGAALFATHACSGCHQPGTSTLAPDLAGLFGRQVRLADGSTVVADETYLRRSILDPRAQLVAGYEPLMPAYGGQLSEEEVLALIAYLISLQSPERP